MTSSFARRLKLGTQQGNETIQIDIISDSKCLRNPIDMKTAFSISLTKVMTVFCPLLLLNLLAHVSCWVQGPHIRSGYKIPLALLVSKRPISKEMALAIKMKRLKQLKNEGKDYRALITENGRIEEEKEGKSGEEKADLQNKIVEYKEKVAREREERQLRQINALFLPDVGMREIDRSFYKNLIEGGSTGGSMKVSVLDMPDIYAFNTKRYESEWMTYMRNSQPPLASYDVIIAQGTSAEAMLRYAESDRVKNLILIDASHIYTAGERHGRDYHYSLIKNNVMQIRFLTTSVSRGNDLRILHEGLGLAPSLTEGKKDDQSNGIVERVQSLAIELISFNCKE